MKKIRLLLIMVLLSGIVLQVSGMHDGDRWRRGYLKDKYFAEGERERKKQEREKQEKQKSKKEL